MVTTPLPYNTEVEEDEVPAEFSQEINLRPYEYCYLLRFTPLGRYEYNTVVDEFLSKNFSDNRWIISEEKPDTDQQHFHIVLFSFDDINAIKQHVRNFIYPFFPDRSRGFGNKQMNTQLAENISKGISYCLKDMHQQTFNDFSEECIEYFKSKSYTKSSCDSELEKLRSDFLSDVINDKQYCSNYMIIYSKFGRNVNPDTSYYSLLSLKVVKDPDYANSLTNSLFSKHRHVL